MVVTMMKRFTKSINQSISQSTNQPGVYSP